VHQLGLIKFIEVLCGEVPTLGQSARVTMNPLPHAMQNLSFNKVLKELHAGRALFIVPASALNAFGKAVVFGSII